MIALIPARCGSKELPGKNIKNLCDKPMIAYTIEEAKKSKYIEEVHVSTDCVEIQEIALKYGAISHFLRPDFLATDEAKAIDTYLYTIDRLNTEYGYKIEEIMILQPTSPLRSVKDIDSAVELFKNKKADSVVSYTKEDHPVQWHKYLTEDKKFENIFEDKLLNRQEFRPSYYPNGAIYIFKYDLLRSGKYYGEETFAYIMPKTRSVDIDTMDDFRYAEFLMKEATDE